MTLDINKKRVLILGGSGLLGGHCYDALSEDYMVFSTYNQNKTPHSNNQYLNVLDPRKDLTALLQSSRPDVIINTVALVTVDGCEANEALACQLNVDFIGELVDAMERSGLHDSHLVQISSDSVYGKREDNKNRPWSEQDPVSPLSVYARTKLEGEFQAEKHEGSVSILRTAFYGINPYSEKSLLWWIINNARLGNTMDGWENVFFSPVSASSLANVIKHFIMNNVSGLFNVGSVDACNKYDFVDAVCTCLGLTPTINRVTNCLPEEKIIRPEYSVLDTTKLTNVMPWVLKWRSDLDGYINSTPSIQFIGQQM